MKTPHIRSFAPRLRALTGAVLVLSTLGAHAAETYKIRLAVDEDPIVPRLAESLGYFKQEGVEIIPTKVEDFAAEDYLLQKPLIDGKIDACYHWFNHTVFGARHNLPVTAVMVFNDVPGMTVMVANRVKDQIKSAADFKGRNVAEGAGYGTKSLLTNYLTREAGLPPRSYKPVFLQHDGRQQAVIQGLKEGKVDVMTFQEPITSALMDTGLVTTLYDLNHRESTVKALGAAWPAQSLLMAPSYIKAHPEAAQHLVNALVKAMRYINSHTSAQIIEKLPASYFDGKDRQAEIHYIEKTLPTFAKGNYGISRAEANLVTKSVMNFAFDNSVEGRWRGSGDQKDINIAQLYDNRFVDEAMKRIR